MGSQTGVVGIRGKVGNLTFAKTANGEEVRIEPSSTGDRLKTDPKVKKTLESRAAFGGAGKAECHSRSHLARDANSGILPGKLVEENTFTTGHVSFRQIKSLLCRLHYLLNFSFYLNFISMKKKLTFLFSMAFIALNTLTAQDTTTTWINTLGEVRDHETAPFVRYIRMADGNWQFADTIGAYGSVIYSAADVVVIPTNGSAYVAHRFQD